MSGVEALFERKNAKIIRESVIHLLNNSISHGVEKSGAIEVNLTRKRPDIILTLKDNGRGINGDDIYNKAVEKGLVDPDKDFLTEKKKLNSSLNQASRRQIMSLKYQEEELEWMSFNKIFKA